MEDAGQFVWNIHQNPVNTEIKLSFDCYQAAIQVELFNASMNMVKSEIISSDSPTIQVSNLASGIYFLTIQNQHFKIIKL